MANIGLHDDNHTEEKEFHFKSEINYKGPSFQYGEERTHWTPVPVPTYSGSDLKIHSELVTAGLSAISIRHMPSASHLTTGGNEGSKNITSNFINGRTMLCRQLFSIPGLIQPRCSFYDLHHPELLKLKWVNKLIPEERGERIERVFLKHAKPVCWCCWPFLRDRSDDEHPYSMHGGLNNFDSKRKITRSSERIVYGNRYKVESSVSIKRRESAIVMAAAKGSSDSHSELGQPTNQNGDEPIRGDEKEKSKKVEGDNLGPSVEE